MSYVHTPVSQEQSLITTRLITILSKLIIPVRTRIRLAKKEICNSNSSRWSKEILSCLLQLYQQRLPVPDQLQCGAVCRLWRSATRVVSSFPWLVISSHPLSNTNPLFYSLGHLVFDDIEIVDGKLYAAPKWSNEDASQFLMVFDIQNIGSNGGGFPSTFTIESCEVRLPRERIQRTRVRRAPVHLRRPFDADF
ncbi:hypothetical protein ACLB2K_019884 [Fragaria x ananassa]